MVPVAGSSGSGGVWAELVTGDSLPVRPSLMDMKSKAPPTSGEAATPETGNASTLDRIGAGERSRTDAGPGPVPVLVKRLRTSVWTGW
jgi:hypothetical protein